MKRKCPNCGKEITWLEVSKQMEGSVELPDISWMSKSVAPGFVALSISPIKWKPEEEQGEPVIYTCPECLVEIDDETLKEWGLKQL